METPAPRIKKRKVHEVSGHQIVGARSRHVRQSFMAAAHVTPLDVAQYLPSGIEAEIGEGLLAGQCSIESLVTWTGQPREVIKAILANPVACAWISKAIYAHFQHRACMVDAALYRRAIAGDVQAIKLFYDRMKLAGAVTNIKHTHSIDLTALSDDDLKRLIKDGNPAGLKPSHSPVIDAEYSVAVADPNGAGASVPEPTGTGATAPGGALPVLPGDDAGAPEATSLPSGGQDAP